MHAKIISGLATGALALAGLVVPAGSASASETASESSDAGTTVTVSGGSGAPTLDRMRVHAGLVKFRVRTTARSSDITMFRPKGSATTADFQRYLGEEFSQDPTMAAQGTRDLTAHFTFYGLAQVQTGVPESVTENLPSGVYYISDLARHNLHFTTLSVVGEREGEDLGPAPARVDLTSADRFEVSGRLPAHGSVIVRNVADTPHFMSLVPVKKGTTDAQVQAFFDSHPTGPPAFARPGPQGGIDVLSPGVRVRLSYDLPAGTYVLLCFVADDMTGMPHAFMGMHKVVVLH